MSTEGLVLEVIDDGGDHADVLEPGRVLVAAVDAELPLVGGAYLAQLAVGVLGEALGGLAGVLGGLGNHLGLDVVESRELIGDDGALVVLIADDGDALAHELCLAAHELAHEIDIPGDDGDDAVGLVAVAHGLAGVAHVGLLVHERGGRQRYLLIAEAVGLEETDDGLGVLLNALVELCRLVAEFLELQRPRGLVGLDFLLGEAFGGDGAVEFFELHNALFDGFAAKEYTTCEDQRLAEKLEMKGFHSRME